MSNTADHAQWNMSMSIHFPKVRRRRKLADGCSELIATNIESSERMQGETRMHNAKRSVTKILLFLTIVLQVSESLAADVWPQDARGFWRVMRSTLQADDQPLEERLDRDILIISKSKFIHIEGIENGLPAALMNKITYVRYANHRDGKQMEGQIRFPLSTFQKGGAVTEGHIDFPLEMKVFKNDSPARLEVSMHFEKEDVRYEAVRLGEPQGARLLNRLLKSELLCSPELRKLLVSIAKKNGSLP